MRGKWIGLLIGLIVGISGCTPKEAAPAEPKAAEPAPAPAPAEEPAVDPVAEASAIFEGRCTVCHGAGGKGDGAGSAALDPKPRDLTSPEWQASVTDEHIQKIIVYGALRWARLQRCPRIPTSTRSPKWSPSCVKYVRGLAK